MKFFLDSAHVHEIEHALNMWNLDGVTTNPKHIQASGKPFTKVIQEIAALFAGTEKTVSVEVNPHLATYEAMVAEAEKLAALSPNFVIKLPATEAGFKSIAVLKEMGIRSNLTLVFSAAQALQAMRMGAFYVSPFTGWKEANGEETLDMIQDIVTIRDNFGFDTEVLVAAVRNGRQIVDGATAGADIITAGFAVYQEAFDHPYTHLGLARFQSFWDQTPYE
ncbi:MAG: transaldolase family protein [Anaerolineae bacterium]|jgi:transaldolase|nr:transaldolase family protein [Anaerolineae bacterium]